MKAKVAQIFFAIPSAQHFERLESLVASRSDSTLIYATGFWKRNREDSGILTIMQTTHESNFETRVRALAHDIKEEMDQSLVLVSFSEVDLIEV